MPRAERAPGANEAGEAALAGRWAAGPRRPLRLADGRPLRIVFPGVPGGGSGPDFRGAILDAGGDLLRGDVEVHLRASGWRMHGHHVDPAYGNVILHVVGANDTGAAFTLHGRARAIPVLVLPGAGHSFPPPFVPPCALKRLRGAELARVLERLSLRRLRAKAARAGHLCGAQGPGQALYALALEQLGGGPNREAFAEIARRLSLAALIERAAGAAPRERTMTAELKGGGRGLAFRRAGLRPLAAPEARLEAAGKLFAWWWPSGAAAEWPAQTLEEWSALRTRLPGAGRAMAVELAVNAILPVALAGGVWSEGDVWTRWLSLPSPGTYGRLRQLEGWLGDGTERTFGSAARLQGGLLLHGDYCTTGSCGRCPMSEG